VTTREHYLLFSDLASTAVDLISELLALYFIKLEVIVIPRPKIRALLRLLDLGLHLFGFLNRQLLTFLQLLELSVQNLCIPKRFFKVRTGLLKQFILEFNLTSQGIIEVLGDLISLRDRLKKVGVFFFQPHYLSLESQTGAFDLVGLHHSLVLLPMKCEELLLKLFKLVLKSDFSSLSIALLPKKIDLRKILSLLIHLVHLLHEHIGILILFSALFLKLSHSRLKVFLVFLVFLHNYMFRDDDQ
jgi:hypothetical protein